MKNSRTFDFNNSSENLKPKNFKDTNIYNLFLLSAIIGALNVLYYSNYSFSIATVILELIILIYYFIKMNLTRYFGFYLIFLGLSLEFPAFVGGEEFYGFKNFRILGINLGIITLLPILMLTFFKNIKIRKIKRNYPHLYKFLLIIVFLITTGVIFGLVQILINDNNIQNLDNLFTSFINEIYLKAIMPLLLIFTFLYIISWEEEKLPLLEKYLIAFLIGTAVSLIVSLTTGNFGIYSKLPILLGPATTIYIPFIFLFPFYSKYKSKVYIKILMFFGLLGTILSLIFNASGKLIILIFLIPLGILLLLLKRKKIFNLIILLIILFLLGIFAFSTIPYLTNNYPLFKIKLNQVTELLKFWEENWIQKMSISPRVRILEFLNIFNEYLNKPWFFMLGKGFMGTFKDYTGMLTNWQEYGATYSINQWINGTFYSTHETLNVLFLTNGLMGLIVYFYLMKIVIVNFTKNPWILIGGFWFLMFYGYSFTITAYGLTSLLVGFVYLDNEKNTKKLNKTKKIYRSSKYKNKYENQSGVKNQFN